MAEEVQIGSTGEVGLVRNPLGVVGLTLITLGIYGIVWYFKVNKELAALGKAHGSTELGDSPGKSTLAVTLGALVIVPAFLSFLGTWKRLAAAEKLVGRQPGLPPVVGLLIMLFVGPVGIFLLQSNMNKVLKPGT